jgi:hypothetical protein
LGQDLDAIRRPACAITEYGEDKAIVLGGQVEERSTGPVRLESVRILSAGLGRAEKA